jgi:hypothetical protein
MGAVMNQHEDAMKHTGGERPGGELGELVRELDPVPEAPREAMWARIQEQRIRPRRVIPLHRRVAGPAWRVAAVLAATLVVGVGIGRLSRGPVPASAPDAVAGIPSEDDRSVAPYRMAAITHLVSSQALLATYPTEAAAGRAGEVADWAGTLLMTTRLLRESPAAEDAELGTLLADLEILLAQMAALPSGGSQRAVQSEVDIINDGIDRKNVLPRIRVATAGRAAVAP